MSGKEDAAAGSSMTSPKRRRILHGTLLCVLVLVLAWVLVIDTERYKLQIEQQLSTALGKDVKLKGPMSITVFPPVGVVVRDLCVMDRGKRILSVEEISIGVRPFSLLTAAPKLTSIAVKGAKVDLVRDKDGSLNIALGRSSEETGDHRTYSGIDKIVVEDLSFSYSDLKTGSSIALVGVDLTAFGLGSSALAERGIITLDPVVLETFGGKGRGKLSIDMLGGPARFTFSVVLEDFRCDRVLKCFGKNRILEGTMDLKASLSVQGSSWDEMVSSLSGILVLEGDGLVVPDMDLDDAVTKLETSQKFNLVDLGAFFFVGPLGAAATHSYKVAGLTRAGSGGQSVIIRLMSKWKIKDGIAVADDVALATTKNRIALKGAIDLPVKRFVDMQVGVLDENGQALAVQSMKGPLSSPFKSPLSIWGALSAAGKNVIKKVGELAAGGKKEEGEPFYRGVVPHPEPEHTLCK